MKQSEFEHMRRDEYSDTNGPLASMLVAAFWSAVGIVILVEVIRLIIWLL